MVGIGILPSYWRGLFSGAMLVSGRVMFRQNFHVECRWALFNKIMIDIKCWHVKQKQLAARPCLVTACCFGPSIHASGNTSNPHILGPRLCRENTQPATGISNMSTCQTFIIKTLQMANLLMLQKFAHSNPNQPSILSFIWATQPGIIQFVQVRPGTLREVEALFLQCCLLICHGWSSRCFSTRSCLLSDFGGEQNELLSDFKNSTRWGMKSWESVTHD